MRFRLRLFILVLAACGIPAQSQQPADSAGPAYNIELIVFRTTSAQGGAENWNTQSSARGSFTTSGETAPSSGQAGRFVRLLPASQYQLTALASKLRSTGVYVPVAHVAWTQTASAWGTRAGFPLERLGANVEGLTGTVFLERGQYLHLGMTLSYAMVDPPAGLGAAPGTVFTLSESRRIRFYERNYYDHPAFGVIALVTPAQGTRPAGR